MAQSVTAIQGFLAFQTFAVVGVSEDPEKYGHIVYHDLKDKGFKLFAVNPRLEKLGDDACYPSLKALPEPVDGAVLVVPPPVTEQVVREAAEAGIPRVWMQPGSESDAALQFCEANNILAVHDVCIMILT
ncbi:MAG: CoA-binding protein [Planctomycetes bacterium]|nr:CoA-binding protein [Planctomycetota bacterium]